MKNVTEDYIHMLSAFEADFDLRGFNSEEANKTRKEYVMALPYSNRLANDFELFDKFVWKLIHGQIKIMELGE